MFALQCDLAEEQRVPDAREGDTTDAVRQQVLLDERLYACLLYTSDAADE